MTEGKPTGIPTIQEELRDNGSPKATFETDDERRAVTVEIPIHPDFLMEQGEPQNEPQYANSVEDAILQLIQMNKYVTREEMASQIKIYMQKMGKSMKS